MTKAAELLKLTTLSIGDIGSAVGYENALHFSRAFKNVYGVSPRTWRSSIDEFLIMQKDLPISQKVLYLLAVIEF